MTGSVDPTTFDRMVLERGLSIHALAKESGLSKGTLASVRAGNSVDMKTLIKLAETFKRIPVRPDIGALLAS